MQFMQPMPPGPAPPMGFPGADMNFGPPPSFMGGNAAPVGNPAPVQEQRPRVRVTEADKLAWMRQFLSALEQWKTCLDTLFTAEDDIDRQVDGVDVLTGARVNVPEPRPMPAAEDLVAMAAAQQAHAAQYAQIQAWQQNLEGPKPSPGRFADDQRPMRMCKHLVTAGFCRQGDQCQFGHNAQELNPSSPDLRMERIKETKGNTTTPGGANGPSLDELDLRLKKKKERCQRFDIDQCRLGSVCPFAHGAEEVNTVGLAVYGKVKMQLCKNWENGRCTNGDLCMNAHGDNEIGRKRPPAELEKRSTKVPRQGEIDQEPDDDD